MNIIDSHVHVEAYSWRNLQEMAMNGVKAVVTCTVCPWRAGVDMITQEVLIERLLRHEAWRAKENNIDLFVAIGVVAVAVPTDVEEFFGRMKGYLKSSSVVAIGEIGFDPRSQTCSDIGKQKEIFAFQLKLAKKLDMPVIVHTPPDLRKAEITVEEKYDKLKILQETIELVHEIGVKPNKVVLDHLEDEEWIKVALDNGFYGGITVQPWRGLGPEKAAQIVKAMGPERLMLNSDSSTLPSDHLAVPEVVFHLKKAKVPEESIRSMVYNNAVDFYGLAFQERG
jgi:predicted metal-dependent TIM-barrel fold hydrolase